MNLYSKLRLPDGFDRDLKMLLFSMAFRRIALGFLVLVRPIYFALLGFSPTTIGLLLSVATFVTALRHIIFGILSDKYGRKPFILLGGFCETIRLAIFALSTDIWFLALAQAIGALDEGAGAGQPVVSGYITDKTMGSQRPTVFTTLGITNALATTIGFLMTSLIALFQNNLGLNMIAAYSWLWWIGAAASAASMLAVLSLREVVHIERKEVEEKNFMGVKSWAVIARFSLVRSLSGLGWGLIGSLLPLYFFIRFGVGSEVLGPVYAFARLLTVFTYLFIPKIIIRFGEISAIIVSRFAAACVAVTFSITDSYSFALFLLILYRVVIHFSMPIRQSFATTLADSEETATVVGVSSFSRMTLQTIAPTAAGYMFETVSLSLPFLFGSGLIVANAILYNVFYNPKRKQ